MRATLLLGLLLLATAAPSLSQVQPQSGGGDPHLQQVDYDADRIVQLRGAPGYQMMIELSADEQVQSVALGDSSAWQISVNKEGDRLFLKPTQAEVTTNMTVVTSLRVYNFDLAALSAPAADMPYTVQFRYPARRPRLAGGGGFVDVGAIRRRISRYKVSGDRSLWPAGMTDDGQHTFISWPRTAAIPAIYSRDSHGNEVLVNGMMGTDDVYVIDGAPERLTFRIDGNVAYAVRARTKKGG